MITLTHEQSDALKHASTPVRVVDPETQAAYVLVREESYQQIERMFAEGPLSTDERQAVLAGVWRRAGWADPAMDDYAKLLEQPKS
jgi:hypothetical protein